MDRVFPHSDDTRVGSIFFRCSEFVCFELVVLQSGLHGKVAAKLITYIGYGAAAIEFRTQRCQNHGGNGYRIIPQLILFPARKINHFRKVRVWVHQNNFMTQSTHHHYIERRKFLHARSPHIICIIQAN